MNQAEKIKKLLCSTFREPADGIDSMVMDERILSDASTSMKQAIAASQRIYPIAKWRKIMRTRTVKLTTAAAVLLAAFVLATWDRSTAWSFEQTIAAIKQLKNLQIAGKMNYWSEIVDFNCWICCPDQESESGAMRLECEKVTMIARLQDETVYFYWPRENIVMITKQGRDIEDLKFWYQAARMSPWLTGKIVDTLRLFTDDWKQTVVTDPASGKEQVHVTCSYKPSNTSISFIVDTETNLIERGKMWMNLQQAGEPQFDAQTVIYNQDIPDDFFEFQIPPGATVITQEDIDQCRVLFKKAEDLFGQKKYAEALDVYRQVHDKSPHLNIAVEAKMMVGICHRRLGEYDKEIETYQAAIAQYSLRKGLGWIYFYLGRAYMDKGQNDKALEAFENCLISNEGVSEPDRFPLKDAHEYIAKIEGH
ncbi:MAG: tetratricopeptide repeat protein [Sedimentisphaerales bacterium]|nr:tetratricopeptide repeat protein [Sedimentisphaerales bacterium]